MSKKIFMGGTVYRPYIIRKPMYYKLYFIDEFVGRNGWNIGPPPKYMRKKQIYKANYIGKHQCWRKLQRGRNT